MKTEYHCPGGQRETEVLYLLGGAAESIEVTEEQARRGKKTCETNMVHQLQYL